MRRKLKIKTNNALVQPTEAKIKNVSPVLPKINHQKDSLIIEPKKFHHIARLSSFGPLKTRTSKKKLRDIFPSLSNVSPSLITLPQNKWEFVWIGYQSCQTDVTTRTWCLFDENCNKFLGFRQNYKREIASLTKIMTTLIAIEAIQKLNLSFDCKVRVTSTAASLIGTTAQLQFGWFVSLESLLYGAILPSGNDAAYTLAEYIGFFISLQANQSDAQSLKQYQAVDLTGVSTNGYVQQFISNMNQKADELQLNETRFSNPHGLQNALNVSSAKDMVILSAQASKNYIFRTVMSTMHYKCEMFQDQELRKKTAKRWWNTNKLLAKDWEGVKTGQTNSAGSCLSSLKQGVYIVVLNSSNSDTRFSDTQKIYNWYMEQREKDSKRGESFSPCKRRTKTEFRYLQTFQTETSL